LANGAQVSIPQSNGTIFQDVLAGGNVEVSGGTIVLAPGSIIDVSGAMGSSTLAAAGSGMAGAVFGLRSNSVASVSSAGGTISIDPVIGAVLEGSLLARGGGAADGGTLKISIAPHGAGIPDGVTVVPAGPWPQGEPVFLIIEPTV